MSQIKALTGLRAVAAVWVVLFHYRGDIVTLVPAAGGASGLMDSGYLGVDAFFALSGFVLAYNYADAMARWRWSASRDFLRNRVARVWPVHLVTLHLDLVVAAVVGALGVTAGGHRRTPSAYLQSLTMTHDWFSDRPSFNSPAWSISAEWAAYLLCPLLLLVLARVRRPTTALSVAVAAYAVMMTLFLLFALPNGNVEHAGLLRIAAEFTAGLFLFRVYQADWPWLRRLAFPLATTIAVVLLAVPASHHGHYWLAPALGLLVLALARDAGPLGRLLSTRSFVFWGEVSYCLYMSHVLVRPGLVQLADPADLADAPWWQRLLVLTLYAAALAAAAVALHLGVEVPARRLLRARRAATPPATPVPELAPAGCPPLRD